MLVSGAVSNAKDLIVVEWAPLVKANGIADQQVILLQNELTWSV